MEAAANQSSGGATSLPSPSPSAAGVGGVPGSVTSPAIPTTVQGEAARTLYKRCNLLRGEIKHTAAEANNLRVDAHSAMLGSGTSETVANITLAYRHLEDASMRLGKALQAIDGGVSVYDKSTTVGA